VGFTPAMSGKAKKTVGRKIRAWHLRRRSGSDLTDLAEDINPQVRGWFSYYGAFYRSELGSLAWRIDQHLVRWAMHKFKRLRGRPARAWAWLDAVRQREPMLFAYWHLLPVTRGGLWEPYDGRLSRTVCAVRRFVVSPTQLGGTWRNVPGSDGLPGRESARGQEHVRKAADGRRRPTVALRDPRDTVKAGLLEAQSPAMKVSIHRNDACNRCHAVLRHEP